MEALKAEIGTQPDCVISTRAEYDPQTGQFFVDIPPARKIERTRCSLIAGEVIASLRTSLDYLMYEAVALDNGGVYFEQSQFPIIARELRVDHKGKMIRGDAWGGSRFIGTVADGIDLIGGGGKKSLKLLSPGHQAIVTKHQPYSYGYGYHADHPLGLLANLSNQDKHRLLVFTYHSARPHSIKFLDIQCTNVGLPGGIGVTREGTNPYTLINQSARDPDTYRIEIVTGPVTGPDPTMDVVLQYSPEITLNDQMFRWGTHTTTDAIQGLSWMVAQVAKIVSEFEPDFG
jgi:hypothetical protein